MERVIDLATEPRNAEHPIYRALRPGARGWVDLNGTWMPCEIVAEGTEPSAGSTVLRFI